MAGVSPESNTGPRHDGDRMGVDTKCMGAFELANITFDGCLRLELDMKKLCLALDIHAYLFGSLFLILLFTALVAFIHLMRNGTPGQPRRNKNFILTINVMMILFGIFRALFLFIDPYGLKGILQNVGALLFQDLAVPCLTSAFALVQWAFLELIQVKRMSFALQSSKILITMVICHFLFVAAIDFILFYVGKDTCFLMTVCQAVNTAWGLALTIGFCYVTQKLLKRDKEHRLTLKRSHHGISSKYSPKSPPRDGKQSSTKMSTVSGRATSTSVAPSDTNSAAESLGGREALHNPMTRLRNTIKSSFSRRPVIRKSYLTKVKNVGILTTIVGLGWFSLSLYGMIAVYNPFENAPMPSDWGWYAYQTLQR